MAKGKYVFVGEPRIFEMKVSLMKDCYCIIKLSNEHSFDDLHLAIQDAFEFDDDHLYSFFMDNKSFSENAINSPHAHEGRNADEEFLGPNLNEKQKFMYLFDFGDCWEFKITVTKVIALDKAQKSLKPELVKFVGNKPEQYPDFDNDIEAE